MNPTLMLPYPLTHDHRIHDRILTHIHPQSRLPSLLSILIPGQSTISSLIGQTVGTMGQYLTIKFHMESQISPPSSCPATGIKTW